MIKPESFYGMLKSLGISFFTGVPDSTLKSFCSYIDDHSPSDQHIIAVNEGSAIALASGVYLATNRIPLVYMQNSGLGNAINPLLSLADPEVYRIPILILVGWRGEPGKKDEPQHVKQGRIQEELLEALELPFEIIDGDEEGAKISLGKARKVLTEDKRPFALLVQRDSFEPYEKSEEEKPEYELTREEAIQIIINSLSVDDVVVSTTGKTSRELFEYREATNSGHQNDFLTVGSMGHCSHIALGIAMKKPDRNIICLDGDGAVLMHMGSLAAIGSLASDNFKHIILNNGVHDSVGGQPTVAFDVDFPSIAKDCGFRDSYMVKTRKELENCLTEFHASRGPSLLEVRVKKGARKNLGRPTISPWENKDDFMRYLRE